MTKRLLSLLLVGCLLSATAPAVSAAAYEGKPKLVVVLVIDQFRGDYLERYRADFKGKGFRLFLDHGAWFPDCYYGYANLVTAAGHATLGTGAYTDGHGIGANEWWDIERSTDHQVSSVEDERYSLVKSGPAVAPEPLAAEEGSGVAQTVKGTEKASLPATEGRQTGKPKAPAGSSAGTSAPASEVLTPSPGALAPAAQPPSAQPSSASDEDEIGASPRNEMASTFGDELRLATQGRSRVYGVSLKDRAAILPSGHAANGAFWIDHKSGKFVTSTYYMQQLPYWAQQFNDSDRIQQAITASGVAPGTPFYDSVGSTPEANKYELDFARTLIKGEQLGRHDVTDLITISLSANDISGHAHGPDSPQEKEMVDSLDQDLDGFFSWLDKNVEGGLSNVWVTLSADHGVAPNIATASRLGMPALSINNSKLAAHINQAMNAKFSPGENLDYILPHSGVPWIILNRPLFERAGINEKEAEDAVQAAVEPAVAALVPYSKEMAKAKPADSRLPAQPSIARVVTRLELRNGELPPTQFGNLLAHSYTANNGWYVLVVATAYEMPSLGDTIHTTHFSPWSYDRHVPLAFYGSVFIPGTYRGRVEPVDMAVTLSSLLGTNLPSASVGKVLTQALKTTVPAASGIGAASAKPTSRRSAKTVKGSSDSAEAPESTTP